MIGSSCIGASVLVGISNNSGGSLVHRGPAYTEMALFAAVDASGAPRLVNHLAIELGETPEEILSRIESGTFTDADIREYMSGNLCRCAAYPNIVAAVREARPLMKTARS